VIKIGKILIWNHKQVTFNKWHADIPIDLLQEVRHAYSISGMLIFQLTYYKKSDMLSNPLRHNLFKFFRPPKSLFFEKYDCLSSAQDDCFRWRTNGIFISAMYYSCSFTQNPVQDEERFPTIGPRIQAYSH